MADQGARPAGGGMQMGQSRGFADLIVAIPFGLAMDQLDGRQVATGAPIVGGQVIASQSAVIAEEKVLVTGPGEPWVMAGAVVPEMEMRVNHGNSVISPGLAYVQPDKNARSSDAAGVQPFAPNNQQTGANDQQRPRP